MKSMLKNENASHYPKKNSIFIQTYFGLKHPSHSIGKTRKKSRMAYDETSDINFSISI